MQTELTSATEKLDVLQAAKQEVDKELVRFQISETQIRDWGIQKEKNEIENGTGWRNEELKHQATKSKLALEEDSNKRKGTLIAALSGSALFFLGLRFVKIAVWQTWFYPVVGAIGGWFFSRFIL